MTSEASLSTLVPELFSIISDHIPLHARSPTLLSLALTNHDFFDIVYPLLCSCLILKNENDAVIVLQRILSDTQFGQAVRQLHIMSELSLATRNGERPFDVITGLKKAIAEGLLPHVHILSLHFLHGWRKDATYHRIQGFGQLHAEFWKEIRSRCPRLRGIILSGLGDSRQDPWLNDSGIYDLSGLRGLVHLGITFEVAAQAQYDGTERLLRNIRHLSPSLHTLILGPYLKYESPSAILSLDFPGLISLALAFFSVKDTSEAMAFWRRHPSLECLKLTNCTQGGLWFDETIEPGVLPSLRHLETNFKNARALVPILPQIISLSIHQSYNAQVPYLLRSAIPEGLHNLKSLEISQNWYAERDVLKSEGGMWYETADGEFHQEMRLKNAGRGFFEDYIHSIARGAPNLEELGLHGTLCRPSTIKKFSSALAEFHVLERLYYPGIWDTDYETPEDRIAFFTVAREFAESCKSLKVITDINPRSLPYFTAKICRNEIGEVNEVIPGQGCGLQIGREDEPFPSNRDPLPTP